MTEPPDTEETTVTATATTIDPDTLTPEKIADLRFSTARFGVSGYDEDEVDNALDALAERVARLMRKADEWRAEAMRLLTDDDHLAAQRAARDRGEALGPDRGPTAAGPLAEPEHRFVELLGRAWDTLLLEVVQPGSQQGADLAELVGHMHALQNAVLAQAAARAYPDRYRPLGLSMAQWQEAQP